ncbi:hypothetical protein ACLOJK_032196 [Asimina triloba]
MSARKKKTLRFSLSSCGCRDTKSISISPTVDKSSASPETPTTAPAVSFFSSETPTSSSLGGAGSKDDASSSPIESSSTFSSLLSELNELEQSVLAWGSQAPGSRRRPRHVRSRSESWRIGESVAVVKESDDPLGDFRKSMLQMIVEKEIVGAQELKELVLRFLELNARQHHAVILRAFMEIWNDVFPAYQATPETMPDLRP